MTTTKSHPKFAEPIYQQDKDRLVAWLSKGLPKEFELTGDEMDDYLKIVDMVSFLIAYKLSENYKESQPDLPVEELSPFIITSEGMDEFSTICRKQGISENSYWFLGQAWMRRQLIYHTINYYINGQVGDVDIDKLNTFANTLCGEFIATTEND